MSSKKEKIEWTLKSGQRAWVTVELVTDNDIDLDGDVVSVPTCDLVVEAHVAGHGCVGFEEPIEKSGLPFGAVAHIGKLVLQRDQLEMVNAAISRVKDTPEWKEYERKQAEADNVDVEYNTHRDRMRKIMGY